MQNPTQQHLPIAQNTLGRARLFKNINIPLQPFHKQTSQQLQHLTCADSKQLINHIYDNGKKLSMEQFMKKDDMWKVSLSNELDRVMQGVGNRIIGTDTMDFISKTDVPKTKKVTYANFVCDFRPLKTEKYRVRMTIGGDKLEYEHETASPAASLIETKLLLNSVISDAKHGARFLSTDLKDNFLQTVMKDPEYMRIHRKYITEEIKNQYNTDQYTSNDDFIYCRIKRGMYGLKQAARLAYDLIKQRLEPHGYKPDPVCPNLWTHDTRRTVFCLCVDDFGVKYFSKEDAEHLLKALKDYKITIDWKGSNYCGLALTWNYDAGWVDITMPNYIQKTLKKLEHPSPRKPVTQHHISGLHQHTVERPN